MAETEVVRKETIGTAHGEIEYETVDCCNCDSKVMVDDAVSVGIGLKEYTCRGMACDVEHKKPETTRNMCEFCAESIFDYSGSSRGAIVPLGIIDRLKRIDMGQLLIVMMVGMMVLLIVSSVFSAVLG